MNKKDILEVLKQYSLPKDEFIILSGAALVLLNIKKETGDIDIAVTNRLYLELLKKYKCIFDKYNKTTNDAVYFIDGVINFGKSYLEVPFMETESYRVQTPSSIKQLKLTLNRTKDQKDIELIEKWEKRNG